MLVTIFEAGKYPQGDFTREDIQKLAKNYSPNIHEAPLVVEHYEEGKPIRSKIAYGWIESLEAAGDKLKARFRQVNEDFKKWVNSGALKKRSVEIYQDLKDNAGKSLGPYVRALAFLGSSPPQVKGMEDIQFAQGESAVMVFDSGNTEKIRFAIEEKKEGDFMDPKTAPGEGAIMELQKQVIELQNQVKDLQAKLSEAETGKKKLEGDIAEKEKELAKFAMEKKAGEFRVWAEKSNKIAPKEIDGVVAFMMGLNAENTLKFGEGGSKTPLDYFKESIMARPDIAAEGEKFTKTASAAKGGVSRFGESDPEMMKIHEKAMAFSEKHNVSYEEALSKIQY